MWDKAHNIFDMLLGCSCLHEVLATGHHTGTAHTRTRHVSNTVGNTYMLSQGCLQEDLAARQQKVAGITVLPNAYNLRLEVPRLRHWSRLDKHAVKSERPHL